MKVKTAFVCALTIMMFFLVLESSRVPKSKPLARNWGPQSMLYLKGRYGKRYVSSDHEEKCHKLELEDLNAILKSYKSSEPLKFLNNRRRLTGQNTDI